MHCVWVKYSTICNIESTNTSRAARRGHSLAERSRGLLEVEAHQISTRDFTQRQRLRARTKLHIQTFITTHFDVPQ